MKQKSGNYRWRILGLLFFATTLNYIDRQVLGILKPFIASDLGWTEISYGNIVSAFQIAYALGLLLAGTFLDKYGTKPVYGIAVTIWSIACAFHSAARSVLGFAIARIFLGLGESANFPAAVKSVSEWFPKKERATANGIFNSGSNVGAFVTPLIISFVTLKFGWRMAFVITGTLGFIWIILWLISYQDPHKHKKLNAAELEYILSDNRGEETSALSWLPLLKHKQSLAICILKFSTDWVWWLMLFWTPDFLNKMFNVNLNEIVLPLIIIYTVASIGGIFGGWLSSSLIKKGKSIDFSRKTAMLVCAICMVTIVLVPTASRLWVSVLLLSLSTAFHQGWSSNLFALASDIFPKNVVGRVVSLAGFTAAIAGALTSVFIGIVLQLTNSYTILFAVAGSMYLSAWFILKMMIPKIEPVKGV